MLLFTLIILIIKQFPFLQLSCRISYFAVNKWCNSVHVNCWAVSVNLEITRFWRKRPGYESSLNNKKG